MQRLLRVLFLAAGLTTLPALANFDEGDLEDLAADEAIAISPDDADCQSQKLIRHPDGQYRPYDSRDSRYDKFGRIVIPYPDGTWRYNDGKLEGSKPDPYNWNNRFQPPSPNWSKRAWEQHHFNQRYLNPPRRR